MYTLRAIPHGPGGCTALALAAVVLTSAAVTSQSTIARLPEPELVHALRAEVDRRTAADEFAGTVLLVARGKTIFSGAYGVSDRARRTPNTLETKFRIGSMNKMFTAVATLTLAQAGKLSLNDPIGKYLKDYPNKTLASKVTVHHLLTHTGGTGDIFGPQFAPNRRTLRTHRDFIDLYGARDLLFEPGSQWAYSNYGFVLLGAVIEAVSGRTYYDYVRDHVYGPAGMTSSGSEPEDVAVPNRSIGYTKRGGGEDWQPNTDLLGHRGTAAGGGYSTVLDLGRFADALMGHKLLNAKYTDLLLTGKVPARAGQYAYGFIESRVGGVRAVGHGGGFPGMNGELLILPESGYVIAVLANLDPPAATRLSQFITQRLPLH